MRSTSIWLFLTPPAGLGSSQTLLAAGGCVCEVAAQLSLPLPMGTETVGVQIGQPKRRSQQQEVEKLKECFQM